MQIGRSSNLHILFLFNTAKEAPILWANTAKKSMGGPGLLLRRFEIVRKKRHHVPASFR